VRLAGKPLYYVGKVHGIHLTGDGVGSRNGLEDVEKTRSAVLTVMELWYRRLRWLFGKLQ